MVETGFQLQRTMITTRTGAAKGVRAIVRRDRIRVLCREMAKELLI